MGSCQNRDKVKTLSAYNSKTLVHKLMKLCILIYDNKMHIMTESSLQLILCKSVIKKLKNFKDLFQSVAPKFPN